MTTTGKFVTDDHIVRKTEKAFLLGLTFLLTDGSKSYKELWIPKSVYNNMTQVELTNGDMGRRLNEFIFNEIWIDKIPNNIVRLLNDKPPKGKEHEY